MDYCLGDGAGGASMWTGQAEVDVDGDGDLDGIRLDFDGDGAFDDALADFDGDGLADHAALNLDDGAGPLYTDDGSGTWALTAAGTPIGPPRWFGLDGVEHPASGQTDFDGDGLGEYATGRLPARTLAQAPGPLQACAFRNAR